MSYPCTTDPRLFDSKPPEDPDDTEHPDTVKAKEMCVGCPMLFDCRAVARERREWGVWGGESEKDRAYAGYPSIVPADPDAPVVVLKKAALSRRSPIGEDGRAVCPSVGAYKRHKKKGEDPFSCGCAAAYAAFRREERKLKKQERAVTSCPSEAAYKRHLRYGEDPGPCGCRDASAAARADQQRAKDVREKAAA